MTIQQIKQQLSIERVLQHYGLEADKNNRLCCPFHDDKTPSMQIYPKTNTYCCFSTNCQADTGDVIDFIQLMESCSKHQAILKAKQLCEPMSQTTTTTNFSHQGIINRFWESCREGIKRSKNGQAYLKERCLDGIEAGYCGEKSMKNWPLELQEAARKVGLLKSTNRPHFQHCVIFPLKNEKGEVVSLYGRGVNDKRHVYLPGTHQGLYPSYPDKATETLVITESVIDCASLLTLESQLKTKHSPLNTISLYGVKSWTQDHQKALSSLSNLQEVILFFDGDAAGKEGEKFIAEKLRSIHPSLKITAVPTPEGEDVNSLLVAHEPEVLQHLIEKRTSIQTGELIFSSEKQAERKESEKKATNSYQSNNAHYSLRGVIKPELDSLKITLLIQSKNGKKHRSKVDLYEFKQVQRLAKEAGEQLNINPETLLEELQIFTDQLEEYREATQTEEKQETKAATAVKVSNKAHLVKFLKSPNLLKKINEKIGEAGVTGEKVNRLFLFGIATSYKMPQPLNALIQGSSGSGKTHLLLKISQFIPPEAKLNFTRVTESSFYNYGEYDLANKLLCFEDLDGLKEEALLAVRELLSRGMLSSSTSGKDDMGNIQSYVRVVYGPVASLSCTTQGELYEDNMGRCFLIAVDESAAQTQRIITHQNKQAAGLIDTKKAQAAIQFLQDCVRLLKPYQVVNPYAQSVQLPEKAHKIRRLNALYQSYVQQITLLHQYQREQDGQGRLISTQEDLKAACELMFESIVLKVDELDGSLRQFYEQLKSYLETKNKNTPEKREDWSFTQREVRQALNVSKTQLHRYLYQLQSLEYIQLAGGYANRGYHYKVSYWDNNTAFRKQLKDDLEHQLNEIDKNDKGLEHHGNATGTPEKKQIKQNQVVTL